MKDRESRERRSLGNRFLLGVFNTLYGSELTDLCYRFSALHRRYLDHLKILALVRLHTHPLGIVVLDGSIDR